MEKLTNEEKRALAKKKLRREFGGRAPVTRTTEKSSRLRDIEVAAEKEKEALAPGSI